MPVANAADVRKNSQSSTGLLEIDLSDASLRSFLPLSELAIIIASPSKIAASSSTEEVENTMSDAKTPNETKMSCGERERGLPEAEGKEAP